MKNLLFFLMTLAVVNLSAEGEQRSYNRFIGIYTDPVIEVVQNVMATQELASFRDVLTVKWMMFDRHSLVVRWDWEVSSRLTLRKKPEFDDDRHSIGWRYSRPIGLNRFHYWELDLRNGTRHERDDANSTEYEEYTDLMLYYGVERNGGVAWMVDVGVGYGWERYRIMNPFGIPNFYQDGDGFRFDLRLGLGFGLGWVSK